MSNVFGSPITNEKNHEGVEESLNGISKVNSEHPSLLCNNLNQKQDEITNYKIIASFFKNLGCKNPEDPKNIIAFTEEVMKAMTTDVLTGISNRRYLEDELSKSVRLLMRGSSDFDYITCIMINLDNFKSYNDRYSHSMGDLALKHFGSSLMNLKSHLRPSDIVARYGGDEFVVICFSKDIKDPLSQDDISETIKIRIRNTIGNTVDFSNHITDNDLKSISYIMGAVTFSANELTEKVQELLKKHNNKPTKEFIEEMTILIKEPADKNMYKEKSPKGIAKI